MSKMIKLSPLEQKLFDALDNQRNQDVAIDALHAAVYGARENAPGEVRDMQMQLGTLISRINRKMKKARIEPGRLKKTYRLSVFKTAPAIA